MFEAIKSKINLIPANPIPKVKPDLKAFVNLSPNTNPMIVIITGNITVGPAAINQLKPDIIVSHIIFPP
jgi:hypothetical protein